MSSSENILDEIEFTWKISDFSRNCQFRGDAIESPLLSVGNPRHSIWMLKLYPQGMLECYENILTTELVRLQGSMKGKAIAKISIVTSDGNTKEPVIKTNVRSFLWDRLMAYDRLLVQEKDLEEFYLPNDTLTLQCKLTLYGDPLDYVDYTELSENIACLLNSGHCSDLVLSTADREFLVHRTILARRSPKFFQELGLSDDPKVQRVEVSRISTPVLETLLSYLYRGKISPLFSDANFKSSMDPEKIMELLEVAERFNLIELRADVILLSPPTTIITAIHSIRRTIHWVMKLQHGIDGTSNIIRIGSSLVHVRLQLHKVQESKWWNNTYFEVDVVFQCLPTMDEDVHLVCRMTIGDYKKDRGSCFEHPLSFSEASPVQSMPKFECSLPDEDLILKLFLKISNGKETHSVQGMAPSPLDDPSIFGMSLLRDDLTALFEENLTKNGGDVTLVCNDQTIRADRAVLSARSPVFAVMFENDMAERNSDRVDILDIDGATTLRLVRFMYSGNVSKQSFDEDAKLYEAADKYQVTLLFRKCSGFMISHLILDNACDILTMAFMHNDESLMGTVNDFIRINLEAIKETKKWKLLCDTFPRLVEESICVQ